MGAAKVAQGSKHHTGIALRPVTLPIGKRSRHAAQLFAAARPTRATFRAPPLYSLLSMAALPRPFLSDDPETPDGTPPPPPTSWVEPTNDDASSAFPDDGEAKDSDSPPPPSDEDPDDDRVCRICLDSQGAGSALMNPLFRPCSCRGTG